MIIRPRRVVLAVLLVAAAVVWIRINGPVEGRTLLELSSDRGVTLADMLSVLALLAALVLIWPERKDRR